MRHICIQRNWTLVTVKDMGKEKLDYNKKNKMSLMASLKFHSSTFYFLLWVTNFSYQESSCQSSFD